VRETPGCVAYIKCTGSIRRPHLYRVIIERTSINVVQRIIDYPIAKQPSQQNPHASASHQNTRVSYGHNLCVVSVNPRPDGGATLNRHSKSPIDATRALIGRALVLMTLNPFERVAVSLKLVSILLHSSSPPASLVFDCLFHANKFSKDL